MPNIRAITKEQHGHRHWLRPSNFKFASGLAVVNISGTELRKACANLPLAFMKNGEVWSLAAVVGVPPATNLCVLPDGRWIESYVPASLRAYPFSIHKANDQLALCIDEEGSLAPEGDDKGEAFFDAEGKPAPVVKQVMEFLTQWHGGRIALERAAVELDKHKLIVPWTFNVKYEDRERTVSGLNFIDEKALNALPGEAFKQLADAGALAVAYAQMISMQHLGKLADWAGQQGKFAQDNKAAPAAVAAAPAPAAPFQVPAELATPGGDLNLEFLNRK
jgi:hypothetical protein